MPKLKSLEIKRDAQPQLADLARLIFIHSSTLKSMEAHVNDLDEQIPPLDDFFKASNVGGAGI